MSKTPVTLELANTLKALRIQKNIPAKDLAERIGRSSAYITKLEKGEAKSIDNDLLDSILSFLTDGDTEGDELVEKIYAIRKQYPSDKEIEEQLWFVNYDTVLRRLPIPEKLILFLNDKIVANAIDRSVLLKRINDNEALSSEEKNDESIEFNRWFSPKKNNNAQSIKILLEENDFINILDRKVTFASYIFVFAISFYTLKIEKFGEQVIISEEENIELMRDTTSLLNEYKFYSLAEKSKKIAAAETQEQINEIWNSFDTENQEILSDILSGFKVASELDIQITNDRLKKFSANMHWDIWFMLKLISRSYSDLDELSATMKKEFLNEIETLILKYKELPKAQKSIETY